MQKENILIFRKRFGSPKHSPAPEGNGLGSFEGLTLAELDRTNSPFLNEETNEEAQAAAAQHEIDAHLAKIESRLKRKRKNEHAFVQTDSDAGFDSYEVGTGGKIKASGADFYHMVVREYGPNAAKIIEIVEGGGDDFEPIEWNGTHYTFKDGSEVLLKHNHTYLLRVFTEEK